MADPLKEELIQRAPTPARGTQFENPTTYGLKNYVSGGKYREYIEPNDTQHPKDIREGLIEKLIKGIGAGYGDLAVDDIPFLEQYLHPDKDILPKTDLRPTKAKALNVPYRSIPENKITHAYIHPDTKTASLFNVTSKGIEAEPTRGLGHFTTSEAPNYYSLYDVWDFNTASPLVRTEYEDSGKVKPASKLNALAKQIMQRVGQPYAVYNRIAKDDPRLKVVDEWSDK